MLPPKLSFEVTSFIYKSTKEHIDFLRDKRLPFLSWFCPLLTPKRYEQDEVIINRNDKAEGINFSLKGKFNYVMKAPDCVKVMSIMEGQHFGMNDIVAIIISSDLVDQSNWIDHAHAIKCLGTVECMADSELLHLSFEDLDMMQKHWPECSMELFQDAKK